MIFLQQKKLIFLIHICFDSLLRVFLWGAPCFDDLVERPDTRIYSFVVKNTNVDCKGHNLLCHSQRGNVLNSLLHRFQSNNAYNHSGISICLDAALGLSVAEDLHKK